MICETFFLMFEFQMAELSQSISLYQVLQMNAETVSIFPQYLHHKYVYERHVHIVYIKRGR